MKKICTAAIIAFGCMTSLTFAGGTTHWGYSGHSGPEHWGSLDPGYTTCSQGKNQSPINLDRMIEGELAPITVAYNPGGEAVLNNGHTIQVNYKAGSTLTIDGHQFELKQFHFHAPSENTIKNKSFPMEAHFVHADKDGNLAVIALMFEEGAANPEIEKAWAQMPHEAGSTEQLKNIVDGAALLPSGKDYYRFNGSLTTPPCSEGVWWVVLKDSVTASAEQIEKFSHAMHHPNNRPVQPVNSRLVVQ